MLRSTSELSPEKDRASDHRTSKDRASKDGAATNAAFAALADPSVRCVRLDGGVLGLECERLALWEFAAAGFTECYLETDDGSISALFRHQEGLDLEVAGPRSSSSASTQSTYLDPDVWLWAVLRIGEPLDLGRGAKGTLTRITVVTSTQAEAEPSLIEAEVRHAQNELHQDGLYQDEFLPDELRQDELHPELSSDVRLRFQALRTPKPNND